MTTLTATSEIELDQDIAKANKATSGAFLIRVTKGTAETADLFKIELKSGVRLTIDGDGAKTVIDGARGLSRSLRNPAR